MNSRGFDKPNGRSSATKLEALREVVAAAPKVRSLFRTRVEEYATETEVLLMLGSWEQMITGLERELAELENS